MENKIIENNQVYLIGEITEPFVFSHEVFGEGFYTSQLRVVRDSGYTDYLPILVSERLIDVKENWVGQFVEIDGQFRSFNKREEYKNRLVLTIFIRELEVLEELPRSGVNNQILLDGYVCKTPTYRKTPLGREVTDLLVAVNRGYGKSDYIPCITWGRNARFAATFEAGTHVQILGRIQSRPYIKKLSVTEIEERVAYEVSVGKIEV